MYTYESLQIVQQHNSLNNTARELVATDTRVVGHQPWLAEREQARERYWKS